MTENRALRISLCPLDEYTFAYDVQVLADDATVGEYMDALDEFQAVTLADCYGCDGCCHERVPLTWADYFLAGQPGSLADWLSGVGALDFWGEAVDLTLRRKENGACHLLDEDAKCCSAHQVRTFTCRTHCCLPKTDRAEALRAAVINAGEDELVRRMLAEDVRPWADRLAGVNAADYAANGFSSAGEDWRSALLVDLVDAGLWDELRA